MEPATVGQDGQRFALTGIESAGVFTVQLKFRPDENLLTLSVSLQDLGGLEPADALPGLRAVEALRPPNRMVMKLRNGPEIQEPAVVPSTLTEDAGRLLRVCEALATIQEHTVTPVRIPDLTETTLDQAQEWINAARLLRGETLRMTWSRFGVQLHEDAAPPDPEEGPVAVAVAEPLAVEVGGEQIPLGEKLAHLPAARVDPATLVDGRVEGRVVHFGPAGDDSGTVYLVRPGAAEES
jgi:hypothetical protein